jgi:glycosyltransferase involved in cell wall biosynthesis
MLTLYVSMKISVVIPARNEADNLPRCLASLARQTRPVDEIIVVDNDSHDDTALVAVKFPSVTVLSQTTRGRVYARDTGFSAARGDIIARIDADSVVPQGWAQHIEQFYSDKAHHGFAWTGDAVFTNVPVPRLVSSVYNWMVFKMNKVLTGHAALWGSNMALPAGVWRLVAAEVCHTNDIHEDLDLSIHLHRLGVPLYRDTAVPVGATMRRVLGDRGDLWAYLQMWPETLRRHGIWTWPLCWLVGALGLYCASYGLVMVELFRNKIGR